MFRKIKAEGEAAPVPAPSGAPLPAYDRSWYVPDSYESLF
jgi:hypothetical protein